MSCTCISWRGGNIWNKWIFRNILWECDVIEYQGGGKYLILLDSLYPLYYLFPFLLLIYLRK